MIVAVAAFPSSARGAPSPQGATLNEPPSAGPAASPGTGRYDVLFEPVRIGPLTTKNRFYQVPHCNGMGYRDPSAQAAMRRVKAEGGWGVVCTEQVEIHPTSDIAPFIELRIWDDQDLPALARIADAIHEGGALAGIELAHNGSTRPTSTAGRSRWAPGTCRWPRSATSRSRRAR
jgi:dimethylamine/trimethylamine dehydrogenase